MSVYTSNQFGGPYDFGSTGLGAGVTTTPEMQRRMGLVRTVTDPETGETRDVALLQKKDVTRVGSTLRQQIRQQDVEGGGALFSTRVAAGIQAAALETQARATAKRNIIIAALVGVPALGLLVWLGLRRRKRAASTAATKVANRRRNPTYIESDQYKRLARHLEKRLDLHLKPYMLTDQFGATVSVPSLYEWLLRYYPWLDARELEAALVAFGLYVPNRARRR